MKKLLIPLFAIATLAFVGTACEQHSAAELRASREKHGKHDKTEGAEAIPHNPAGSAPVGTYDAANPNPAESGNPPKFFPKK